jgi:4-hydroxybenzoate polyprenyltransferase
LKSASQLFRFLLYSNLFIAACAVMMVWQSSWLFTAEDPSAVLPGFVFFSTLCSYSFHYYLTTHSVIPSDRIEWVKKQRRIHAIIFFISLVFVAWLGYLLIDWWKWLLPAIVATFLYSAPKIPHVLFRSLRRIAIGKTIFLAFIWMFVTAVLPVVIAGRGNTPGFLWYAISKFFFIYSICILFDYRDREDDKASGVRSLVTYLPVKGIKVLFIISLLVFSFCTILLLAYDFHLEDVLLLLFPGVVVALSWQYATRNFSDIFYYFILDGCMALSALLMWIGRFV